MREASFQELLNSAFDYQTENLYTAIPAVVVTVRNNFENLTIDAQPSVNIRNRDGTTAERPVILNIPVSMPMSGTSAVLLPLNVGDSVMLMFSMRGLDVWKRSNGRPTTPSDFRKFDKRDCIAIPISTIPNSPNQPSKHLWPHDTKDLTIVHNLGQGTESEIRIKLDGSVVINTKNKVDIQCDTANVIADSEINVNTPVMNVDAQVNITGDVIVNGIAFSTHVHGDVEPGGGTSGGPQ
ncbi:hypothetical protein D3C85_751890 [compost metagenome]